MAQLDQSQVDRDLQAVEFLSQVYESSDAFEIIDQTILQAIYRTGFDQCTASQIAEALNKHSIRLDSALIEQSLARLTMDGQVQEHTLKVALYSLGPQTVRSIEEADTSFRLVESGLRATWASAILQSDPSLRVTDVVAKTNTLWPRVKREVAIKALGSEMKPSPRSGSSAASASSEGADAQPRVSLITDETALRIFQELRHPLKDAYVQSLDEAVFAWRILSVSPAQKKLLTDNWPRIEIWMDDNVVISALGIRELAADDYTDELVTLFTNHHLQKITFCVHPRTLQSISNTCKLALDNITTKDKWTKNDSLFELEKETWSNKITPYFHSKVINQDDFRQQDFVRILKDVRDSIVQRGFIIRDDVTVDSSAVSLIQKEIGTWMETNRSREEHVAILLANSQGMQIKAEDNDKLIVLVTNSGHLRSECAKHQEFLGEDVLVLVTKQLYRVLRKYLPNGAQGSDADFTDTAMDLLSTAPVRPGLSEPFPRLNASEQDGPEKKISAVRDRMRSGLLSALKDEVVQGPGLTLARESLSRVESIEEKQERRALLDWIAGSEEVSLDNCAHREKVTGELKICSDRCRSLVSDVDELGKALDITKGQAASELEREREEGKRAYDSLAEKVSEQAGSLSASRNGEASLVALNKALAILAWAGVFGLFLAAAGWFADREWWIGIIAGVIVLGILVAPQLPRIMAVRTVPTGKWTLERLSWMSIVALIVILIVLWQIGYLDKPTTVSSLIAIVTAAAIGLATNYRGEGR